MVRQVDKGRESRGNVSENVRTELEKNNQALFRLKQHCLRSGDEGKGHAWRRQASARPPERASPSDRVGESRVWAHPQEVGEWWGLGPESERPSKECGLQVRGTQ